MKLEKEFINVILDSFKSPFLYNEDVYYPMQIILECFKQQSYKEYKFMVMILFDNLPTSYVAELFAAEEKDVTMVVNSMRSVIENNFKILYKDLPKKLNDLVEDEEIYKICKQVGFPIKFLGDYDISVLKIKECVESVLRSYGVNNLYELKLGLKEDKLEIGEMTKSYLLKYLDDFIKMEK